MLSKGSNNIMKKYNFVLAVVATALLTSCNASQAPSEKLDIHEVKVDHYNISYCPYLQEDPRELTFTGKWSDYKTETQFDFVYLNDEDELPYLSLETYVAMLSKDFKEGTVTEVKEEGQASIFTVKKEDKVLLSVKFDRANKKITKSPGGVESVIKPLHNIRNSVNDYIQAQEGFFVNQDLDFVYSWANTNFKTFAYKGQNYFPLSLLDLQISKETSRSFWYLGGLKSVYEVGDTKQYNDVALDLKNAQGLEISRTVDTLAAENYSDKFGKYETESSHQIKKTYLPYYLAAYSKDAFYFVMDNYYGLGQTIGYKSMATFLDNTKYAAEMTSSNGQDRARAYSYATSILNDGHTAFLGSSSADEGTGLGISYYQTLNNDRQALQRILKERRDAQLKLESKELADVRYSDDGKVAYFSFDEFTAVNYDPQEGKPSDIAKHDTYLYFLNQLKAIDQKGGVEKVVIDDTINGGGYLGQLAKLLCLLSKDNSSTIYFRAGENNAIGRMVSKVDVNLDGKIDEEDVTYGNKYKFYILTSSYSFSCGNAFPAYARDNGFATIVGTKSGGGECVVGSSQLPYNSSVVYSSNYHLGYYDSKDNQFSGYEEGAYPSISYIGNFYDVNAVAKVLK